MRIKSKVAAFFALILTAGVLTACAVHTENNSDIYDNSDSGDIENNSDNNSDTENSSDNSSDADDNSDGSNIGSNSENSSTENMNSEDTFKKDIIEETIDQYIAQMTLKEKAAQLFIIQPEALIKDVDTVTAAGKATQEAINQIPVGGFIYLDGNLKSREQVKTMLENVQSYSMERMNLPMLLCVDEEGGAVARVANSGRFDVPRMEDMSVIGAREDVGEAYEVGETIGAYLSDMGFNVDFAPVADVLTNPENQVVKKRAFGSDPGLVSDMASAVAGGLTEQGICPVYKHFPGHGGTAADTHEGYAYVDKNIEELEEQDLAPFKKAIRDGAKMIMIGHISLPEVTGDDSPASMSPAIITDLLREQMGYDGLVVTDALDMGAVTKQYTSAEAAVQTILAGSDLVLMPENFDEAYEGVKKAVESGKISGERLDESLRRILRQKLSMENETR